MACPTRLARVVAFAGLHHQHLLLGGEVNAAVLAVVGAALGSVADAVLAAQIFLDGFVDFVDGHALGNLEEPAAGFARDALQHCLAAAFVAHAAARRATATAASSDRKSTRL